MSLPKLAGWALAALGFFASSLVVAAESSGQILHIFAAASTTNAVDEIRGLFTRDTGIPVQASYGSSATLAQQIAHGADADLFLSADPKWVDHLARHGLVAQRRDLLGNRLVVIVPAGSRLPLAKLEDLPGAGVQNLAMGDPEGVPAGKYARQVLEKLGLWDRLRSKVTPAGDVRQALTFVETQAAEAGIVYSTDAAVSRKVRVAVVIPREFTEPIRYPLAILKAAEGKAAARQFYRFISSPAAVKIFQKYGFEILVGS